MKDILIKFVLRLNIDEWGQYKRGDEDTFYINVFDKQNGLISHPIDSHWDIVDYERADESSNKYRIGRKTGLVILTTSDSKEVVTCVSKDIAIKVCKLLNKEI